MPRRRIAASALLASVALGSCGTPVGLDPAPSAAAPDCGYVLQATPDVLMDLERRSTSSQASTAWGDPPVTLRCGVEPPPPTTADCLSIELPDGRVHDWIHMNPGTAVEGEVGGIESVWVSYGRIPAIEVVVPAEMSNEAAGVLVDLGGAVETTRHVASCVGAAEVEEAERQAEERREAESASDGAESPTDAESATGAEAPTVGPETTTD